MPVSFTHTVKALQPLYAAIFSRWVLGTPCPRDRVAALVLIVSGVGLSAYSELNYTWSGVAFAQMSVVAIVTSAVLQKRYMRQTAPPPQPVLVSVPYASSPELALMSPKSPTSRTSSSPASRTSTPATSPRNISSPTLETNSIFFLTNSFALVLLLPPWLLFDSSAVADLADGGLKTASLLAVTSLAVVAQHFASISVLEIASTPITHSVASTFKRIFVITSSVIWFGNTVAPLNAFGIFLSVCGVALYDRSSRSAGKPPLGLPDADKRDASHVV